MTPEPLLRCTGLVGGYTDEVDILQGVGVEVGSDEVVTIIGPNGAGKSTLVKAVFGLIHLKAGRVEFDGTDLIGMRPHRRVRVGMAYVPQRENIFPTLSVRENLDVGAYTTRGSLRERVNRVTDLFPVLSKRWGQQAGTLSGGERQMVAIARALMADPRLLLLDEPSAALAPKVVAEVFQTIKAIRDSGVAILLVEQNARQALAISDRGYVLETGTNAYTGTGTGLLSDPNVAQLYLGGGLASARPAPEL